MILRARLGAPGFPFVTAGGVIVGVVVVTTVVFIYRIIVGANDDLGLRCGGIVAGRRAARLLGVA